MWPTRFTTYVLNDILQLFLLSLAGMTTFIMLGLVVHQLIAAGLGPEALTQLLPYASVMSLQFAVPATLLFSVCTVFGRLSADNEFIAIKSVGISPWRIIQPTLILAILLSPVAVWINDLAVSWGTPGINRVVLNSLEEIVYRVLRANRSYTSQQGFQIHVKDVQDRWLISPTIILYPSGPSTPLTITAEKANIRLNPANESLTIQLVNWESKSEFNFDGGKGAVDELELPLTKAAQRPSSASSASLVALRDINSQSKLIREELGQHESELLTRSSMALVSGRLGLVHDTHAQKNRAFVDEAKIRIQRLQAEPWRRWAQGFSCLCFVWVGIPMAILRRSADYTATFGACFLPILLIYYPLFMIGVDKAKSGQWHPFAPWLANVVLFLFGAYLMRKVYRE